MVSEGCFRIFGQYNLVPFFCIYIFVPESPNKNFNYHMISLLHERSWFICTEEDLSVAVAYFFHIFDHHVRVPSFSGPVLPNP